MHSISPYAIRCFNPAIESKNIEEKYCVLDKIGQHDLYSLLKIFISGKAENYHLVEDTKQVYKFSDMSFNGETRHLYGWFQVGTYGIKTDIINIDNGQVDFEKAQNNAEIIKHYLHMYIPAGFNEAICMMHSYRGHGVKTLFTDIFSPYFRDSTTLNLQMSPLSYEKAIETWQEANTKELKITKFEGLTDIADQIKNLGHEELELIMKPPRKGTFGQLKEFFNPDSEQAKIVEVLSELGSQVKTVVELNGKKRTFIVGADASNSICRIDFDDSIQMQDGAPMIGSLNRWILIIISEYVSVMYPGLEVQS